MATKFGTKSVITRLVYLWDVCV